MGDPAGIGPEIIIKCIIDKTIASKIKPVIIGNLSAFKRVEHFNNLKNNLTILSPGSQVTDLKNTFNSKSGIIFIQSDMLKSITGFGEISGINGQSSFLAVKTGIDLSLRKQVDAMVTGPICKEAWKAAGIDFPGHTELLAKMTKTKEYSMMFFSPLIKIILVTIHESIEKVPALITKDKVIETCITGYKMYKKYFGIKHPKLACAGLNPHAGENGLFGKEEQKTIVPALNTLKKKGISVSGPYPADTLFTESMLKQFDLIVCLYHDQGLIPFKMKAFYEGVNVTAGLPIIRTSPDHGTAFSIAGKNVADPGSMRSAIMLAREMVLHSKP